MRPSPTHHVLSEGPGPWDTAVYVDVEKRGRVEGGGRGKRGLKGEAHRFSVVSPEPCVLEAQSVHVSCQSHNEFDELVLR